MVTDNIPHGPRDVVRLKYAGGTVGVTIPRSIMQERAPKLYAAVDADGYIDLSLYSYQVIRDLQYYITMQVYEPADPANARTDPTAAAALFKARLDISLIARTAELPALSDLVIKHLEEDVKFFGPVLAIDAAKAAYPRSLEADPTYAASLQSLESVELASVDRGMPKSEPIPQVAFEERMRSAVPEGGGKYEALFEPFARELRDGTSPSDVVQLRFAGGVFFDLPRIEVQMKCPKLYVDDRGDVNLGLYSGTVGEDFVRYIKTGQYGPGNPANARDSEMVHSLFKSRLETCLLARALELSRLMALATKDLEELVKFFGPLWAATALEAALPLRSRETQPIGLGFVRYLENTKLGELDSSMPKSKLIEQTPFVWRMLRHVPPDELSRYEAMFEPFATTMKDGYVDSMLEYFFGWMRDGLGPRQD
ncbi:hypothetical protein VTJ49DRAFT_7712 [Mycothermus thermophilus]|uniref:Uncharacterized protein n=1 Tax=Humicola insolens TaxID=85995 RepID=A0ABR3VHL0_HUMIN